MLAIVLLIGAAVYEEFARDEPPGVRVTIELDLEHADVRDGVTYVPYAVSNDGAKAAENVVVHFEIRRGDEIVEESSADIAFLPNGGVVNGELATELELAQYTVEARLGTLQLP